MKIEKTHFKQNLLLDYSDSGDFEDVNMDQINSGDEFEHVHISENTQAKENEVKSGKRTGMKGSAKNKNKGKSWKKS